MSGSGTGLPVDVSPVPTTGGAFDQMFRAYAAPALMTVYGETVGYYADSGETVSVTGIFAATPASDSTDEIGENRVERATLQVSVTDAALITLPGEFEIRGNLWAVEGNPTEAAMITYDLIRINRTEISGR